MEGTVSEYELLYRLADTAITLAVMGFGLYFLIKKNTSLELKNDSLIEKMYNRDLENIRSLELISKTIEKIETNGDAHTKDIKTHISERTKEIREDLREYRK